jgi:hypothetical protein
MLLDPIRGLEGALNVISRKSRGGLYDQKVVTPSDERTYGGGTLSFLSFLRLKQTQSSAIRAIPPTTPPTIPPIAPPLRPDDVALVDAEAGAIVAADEWDEERLEEAELAAIDEDATADDAAAAEEDCWTDADDATCELALLAATLDEAMEDAWAAALDETAL